MKKIDHGNIRYKKRKRNEKSLLEVKKVKTKEGKTVSGKQRGRKTETKITTKIF